MRLSAKAPSVARNTANRAKADDFAANTLPIVGKIEAAGVKTLASIATALNAQLWRLNRA